MLSPRVRRLKLDYELLSNRFRDWPLIRITGTDMKVSSIQFP